MNLVEFEESLGRLAPKIEKFAATLSPEERDVFASLLELSAIGARQGENAERSKLLCDHSIVGEDETDLNRSVVETLPSRIQLSATR